MGKDGFAPGPDCGHALTARHGPHGLERLTEVQSDLWTVGARVCTVHRD